jgi:uncharacterized protein (TIGR03085 family)
VQDRLASQKSFPELVDTIRNGPPRLSPWAIPALDERANTVEFFVHNEDVRRAAPDWKPREIGAGLSDALWARLRVARLTMRKVPLGIEFARSDDAVVSRDHAGKPNGAESMGAAPEFRMTVRRGTPVVTVIGPPAELTLWATGRTAAAKVRLDGTEAATAMLSQARWRI